MFIKPKEKFTESASDLWALFYLLVCLFVPHN